MDKVEMWKEIEIIEKGMKLVFQIAKTKKWSMNRLEKQILTTLRYKDCKHDWAFNGVDELSGWENYLCKKCLTQISVRKQHKREVEE